jgi:SAM-dependent methyltransferase
LDRSALKASEYPTHILRGRVGFELEMTKRLRRNAVTFLAIFRSLVYRDRVSSLTSESASCNRNPEVTVRLVAPEKLYTQRFYHDQADESLRSARVIAPTILELTGAKSIADVGCGVGTWLRAFTELGADDVLGFDGTWVDEKRLRISTNQFQRTDLAAPPTPPRSFDLAISLEVAEHLPEVASDRFVSFLTSLADVVIFSAAVPGSGGTGHINEQWPDYWRAKFEAKGFVGYDPFRRLFWNQGDVNWWYAQNMFLFARTEIAGRFASLPRIGGEGSLPERHIHPAMVESLWTRINRPTLGYILRKAPLAFLRTVETRLAPLLPR